MTTSDNEAPSTRGPDHERLAVFLGDWEAEGTSYGGTDQSGDDARQNSVPWTSTHTGRWHTGEFFLVQDERARPGGDVFDTLSIMGFDPTAGAYFARTFENHGFYRHYDVSLSGSRWEYSGEFERAVVTFSEDARTQTIAWEWRPEGDWLPLCDRTAVRVA
jgi:hypothetical protein